MFDQAAATAGLTKTLASTDFADLGQLHRGKVRDSYVRGGQRTIIVTDRISAFDVILGTIPFKGQILNGIAHYWFRRSAELYPNHLVRVPDPSVSIVVECNVLKVEMVVRGYLAGSSPTSIWTCYKNGGRSYCGHTLPDGLKQNEPLPEPLITPTTKAEQGEHDALLDVNEVVERGLASAEQWQQMCKMSLEMFALGSRTAKERGLILVDTKYEIGLDPSGQLVFVDEIHTPDSSRYWYADSYEQALSRGETPRALDKEFVRRHLIGLGYSGEGKPPALTDDVRVEACRRYWEIYEAVTGETFVPNLDDPLERLTQARDQFTV